MYYRHLQPILERFAQLYPVVGIMGPRQSGKTTLARSIFHHLPYVSLENLDLRLQAQADPRAFLQVYKDGAIFDEVQHASELLSYLQGVVDESSQKGRYIITGSQNFALSAQISQSLSGRIGITTLLPLSLAELPLSGIYQHIFLGGYPGLHKAEMQPTEFYPSYIQTYIERDVRQIKNINDYGKFQTFVKLCAGRIGQIVNFSSLATDCGISHTTARQWLSVLEASYILFFLQPYYNNFTKRLIKMPKLYFYDTGLACNLLGLEKEEQLQTHYLRGGLFENSTILELLKIRLNQALPTNLFFWRDQTGHEVDCIAEWAGAINPIEIKATSTFHPELLSNLRYFCQLAGVEHSYLIYNGAQEGDYLATTLVPTTKISQMFTDSSSY
jgi:predicted AAA+ superfamily ATPase